jgi:hypothetical protein
VLKNLINLEPKVVSMSFTHIKRFYVISFAKVTAKSVPGHELRRGIAGSGTKDMNCTRKGHFNPPLRSNENCFAEAGEIGMLLLGICWCIGPTSQGACMYVQGISKTDADVNPSEGDLRRREKK